MPDNCTLVSDLREAMRRFVEERSWNQYHSPKNLAMALSVEAAELMEHFLWMSLEESRQQLKDPRRLEQVCDEIADVFGLCLAFCNSLDLELSDVFLRKMSKNVLKYPVEKIRGHYRLED
ncbi:MAG: nucleotide pyrophosphohydrolase [Gemmataceae bacterium]